LGEGAFRHAWQERLERLRHTTEFVPEPVHITSVGDLADIMQHRPVGDWGRGVRPQRTPGLALVTVNVTLGDLTGDELRALADLASVGDGFLWTTRNQNIQYRDVPVPGVAALRAELAALGLGSDGADSAVDVRACTGSAVCSLAISAAPAAGLRIAAGALLARNASLRVHVSGCPNSCAQHQAADIGLAGAKVRIAGVTGLGYTVFVGADLLNGRVAEPIGRVADEDVEAVVSGIIGTWEALRRTGERLVDTMDRVGAAAFAAHIAAIASGFEAGPEPVLLSVAAVTDPATAA
jgi:sulfite reductase beta subunit-like hemoprotein